VSDEELIPAVVTAPEPEATAAPEPEVSQPEVEAVKTFTQEELNEIISKRLAKERSKWERSQQTQTPPPALPPVADFESEDAYRAAVIKQHEESRQTAELNAQFEARVEKALEKYDDFEQVAYSPNVPVSDVMAQAIRASDVGPEVAYYLGLNPSEAQRISQLPPVLQAKEIGRLEVKVTAEPPARRVTNAPAPIQPNKPTSAAAPVIDTTDPRSLKTMSTSEWIAAEQRRVAKRMGLI
jgi:hypothetical protein